MTPRQWHRDGPRPASPDDQRKVNCEYRSSGGGYGSGWCVHPVVVIYRVKDGRRWHGMCEMHLEMFLDIAARGRAHFLSTTNGSRSGRPSKVTQSRRKDNPPIAPVPMSALRHDSGRV